MAVASSAREDPDAFVEEKVTDEKASEKPNNDSEKEEKAGMGDYFVSTFIFPALRIAQHTD